MLLLYHSGMALTPLTHGRTGSSCGGLSDGWLCIDDCRDSDGGARGVNWLCIDGCRDSAGGGVICGENNISKARGLAIVVCASALDCTRSIRRFNAASSCFSDLKRPRISASSSCAACLADGSCLARGESFASFPNHVSKPLAVPCPPSLRPRRRPFPMLGLPA